MRQGNALSHEYALVARPAARNKDSVTRLAWVVRTQGVHGMHLACRKTPRHTACRDSCPRCYIKYPCGGGGFHLLRYFFLLPSGQRSLCPAKPIKAFIVLCLAVMQPAKKTQQAPCQPDSRTPLNIKGALCYPLPYAPAVLL